MTIKNCSNCKHIKLLGKYIKYCSELHDNITIEVSSGWDGHVIDHIEIDEPDEFFCAAFEEKE